MILFHRFRLVVLLPLLIGSSVISGCRTTQTAQFDPHGESDLDDAQFRDVKLRNGVQRHHLIASGSTLRLGVGDALEIEILEQPSSRETCIVMPDGMLFYDLAGGIMAQNRTIEELERILTEKLERQEEYRRPVVSVNISHTDSRAYTILGQVRNPGSFSIPKPTRLLEAIAKSGGIQPDLADLRRSMVIRNNRMICPDFEALIENGDMTQNLFLLPGDYIFVPLVGKDKVHVLGQVAHPVSVPYEPQISLISAIASAGGPTLGAALKRVAIVRGSSRSPRIAIVNLEELMTGETKDFRLQPDDIIWVPKSPLEKIEEYAEFAVRTAVSTLTNKAVRENFGNSSRSR